MQLLFHWPTMSAVPVVLLVCAAVWSTIALDTVYVSPDDGHSCPSGSTCHNLSYYISRSETYFTSNTTIIFMNGEHQLDKQEPVMVVGADNLTLEGQGEWIAGPEENVMQSTAVINCTSGKGGFTFINSSSITIQGLTFLTCGAMLNNRIAAVVFVTNVKQFLFHQNCMQYSTGFGLYVSQCDEVKVSNCSFFDQSQIENPDEFVLCGTAAGFFWFSSSLTNNVLLEISYSNFTEFLDYCGFSHGPIYVYSQNKQMLNATFSHIMCFNNTGGIPDKWSSSCIHADLIDNSASLQITNSIFKQGHTASAIAISAKRASSFNLKLTENQFLNNSGSNLKLQCPPIASTVVIEKSQFIQTLNTKAIAPDYGIAIYDCNTVMIQNLQVQLQNVKTSVKISGSNVLQEAKLEIFNSNFSGNKNSPSSSTIYIEIHSTFSLFNCYFSNNSNALSVITVKNSRLIFSDCAISDNNMTGITTMEGGIVEFRALNKIQNNRASEGAGIKLLPNSQVSIDGILWIYDNIAYQGVGGGIYQLTNLQIPSDSIK